MRTQTCVIGIRKASDAVSRRPHDIVHLGVQDGGLSRPPPPPAGSTKSLRSPDCGAFGVSADVLRAVPYVSPTCAVHLKSSCRRSASSFGIRRRARCPRLSTRQPRAPPVQRPCRSACHAHACRCTHTLAKNARRGGSVRLLLRSGVVRDQLHVHAHEPTCLFTVVIGDRRSRTRVGAAAPGMSTAVSRRRTASSLSLKGRFMSALWHTVVTKRRRTDIAHRRHNGATVRQCGSAEVRRQAACRGGRSPASSRSRSIRARSKSRSTPGGREARKWVSSRASAASVSAPSYARGGSPRTWRSACRRGRTHPAAGVRRRRVARWAGGAGRLRREACVARAGGGHDRSAAPTPRDGRTPRRRRSGSRSRPVAADRSHGASSTCLQSTPRNGPRRALPDHWSRRHELNSKGHCLSIGPTPQRRPPPPSHSRQIW